MKKLLYYLLILMAVVLVSGCELDDDEDNSGVKFINVSSQTVHVSPRGGDWGAFALAPGEVRKIDTDAEVFFTFEPDWAVEVGDNDGGRIYFVDIGSEQVD